MKINYFGHGPYLEFAENGTVLSHDGYVLDCAGQQGDSQKTIDVCLTAAGELIFGVKNDAATYVANIIIPARQYKYQTKIDGDGNPVLNEDGSEQIEQIPIPLSMERVIGNLWTIPEHKNESEEI